MFNLVANNREKKLFAVSLLVILPAAQNITITIIAANKSQIHRQTNETTKSIQKN